MRLPSGVTVPGITEARRKQVTAALSPVNLHIAGVVVLALLCVYLGVRLWMVSGNVGAAGEQQVVVAQSQVAAAEVAAKPLRGVDEKLAASDAEAKEFYEGRLPYAYSDVASQLGAIAKAHNVRLARASYVQAAPNDGVTELRIDASVTGEYRSLAEFINGLERSKSFFLVENLALSGAQNGLVNLQLRIGTWIREPMPVAGAAQGGQP